LFRNSAGKPWVEEELTAAQQEAVAGFVRQQSAAELVASYTEVETSKKDTLANRPELRKAIAHAKRSKAVLVIAKLDRLARSFYVTAMLMQTGVEFVAVDNPYANRMTIQMLAVFAEHEAQAISDRTKAALAAYKARGGILGGQRPESRNLTRKARIRGASIAGEVVRAKKEAA
jgi:DNA invertase Pin-like site-specific DNA recombinase